MKQKHRKSIYIKVSLLDRNYWTKREIVHDEQFLFKSQCFQKLSAADESKYIYMWERVKSGNLVFQERHVSPAN